MHIKDASNKTHCKSYMGWGRYFDYFGLKQLI